MAIPFHAALGALSTFHVAPEFIELAIRPGYSDTAILVPSAEQATDPQFPLGAGVICQLVPPSVDMTSGPPAASSLDASADEATQSH
jgi:hypothetical protein